MREAALRVRFDNGSGCARRDGFVRHFGEVPHIDGLPRFDALDWLPGECARIRPQYEGERDMEGRELLALNAWLVGLVERQVEV